MRYLFLFCFLSLSVISMSAQSNESTDCPPDYAGYLAPRLIVGEQARVVFDIELNVRPVPGLDEARLTSLAGGTHVSVISDPVCVDDFIWWQIELDELQGWVAEGSLADDEYFIEARGELRLIENENEDIERYIVTASGFVEPEGCLHPPDDYEQVQIGYATFNQRTLFMLDNAQRIYDANGGTWANFRIQVTQGSYNAGGVAASFGTHDAGGAVDISVIDTQDGYVVMLDEIMPMLQALRIAGFAAWLRDTDELYDGSVIHIHAIAIGDAEASEIAQQQVSSEFGYFQGFNGLPPEDGDNPIPDIYGDPILCEWMFEIGFDDMREIDD